jgi:hypothetical protein
MRDGPPLDPHEVLDVPPGAAVATIREAFRVRSLRYHPDRGGDAWAFRVVQWAYQTLLERAARIDGASAPPMAATAPPPRPAPPPPPPAPAGSRWAEPRPGIQDRGLDPALLVEVEMVWVLREADVPLGGLGLPGEDRSLGARLTLQWPDRALAADPRSIPDGDRALRALAAAFEEARERPGVVSASAQSGADAQAGRFDAWLSYRSAGAARDALRHLHVGLRARGLGLNQWTRVLAVPAPERGR